MIPLIKMAYRDLGRNRRRSFFSALALGIGLALLLLMAAVMQGEMHASMETSIRLESGHLQVRARSYDPDKASLAWEDLIEDPERLAAAIASHPAVRVSTPRLFASGMVVKGDETVGVRLVGIDPASPASEPYRSGLLAGEFLQAEDREGILIGQPLAERFGLQPGDRLNLLANTSNGDVDEQPFVVRGVYTTHTPGYDQSTVFVPLNKAQALTRAEERASAIFVLLEDRDQAEAVVAAMQGGQYQVSTWEQMNEILIQTEEFAQAYLVVLYLIVLGITATVIVNTLVMSVFERTREIGILSAIGMRSSRIMAIFFAESSLLAIGGILIGLALGSLLVAYAGKYGFFIGDMGVTGMMLGERLYAYPTLEDTVSLTALAFVVTLIAALYPAALAARLEPVEALRGGQ